MEFQLRRDNINNKIHINIRQILKTMKIKTNLFKSVSHNYYRTKIEYFTKGQIVNKRIHVQKEGLTETQKDFYKYPSEFSYRFMSFKTNDLPEELIARECEIVREKLYSKSHGKYIGC